MADSRGRAVFPGSGRASGNRNSVFYLGRQAERESRAVSYPRRLPIAIESADGLYVTDVEGRTYMDCLSGAGTLALGHNHPVAIEAMRRMLDSGQPLHTLDLATPVKDRFVEELFASMPEDFVAGAKVHFCGPTGADAVEAAVKLAKTATGRSGILSFHGGYHGMTHGALGLTGNLGPKLPVAGLMPEVSFLPYPYDYRCPFGIGGKEGWKAGIRYIDRALDDPESGIKPPAAVILEVVQGEGGAIPAPDGWLRELRRVTRERGIPMIVDEVQTGLGRTGRLYAFEHAGIVPDLVVLSKAIGGSLPLAAVVYRGELDAWEPGAHTGTFRGNQLAMAAGSATVSYIREQRLDEHAARVGEMIMDRLRKIQAENPILGDVRGRGLMIGVEVVDAGAAPDLLGARPAAPGLAARIQAECLRRGLILEVGGRHAGTVRFLPPLIVTDEEAGRVCDTFAAAVEAAGRASAA